MRLVNERWEVELGDRIRIVTPGRREFEGKVGHTGQLVKLYAGHGPAVVFTAQEIANSAITVIQEGADR